MRTENDLREAINDRATRAPKTLPVTEVALKRRSIRRVSGFAIATAVTVVAAVAIAPAILRERHDSNVAGAPTSATAHRVLSQTQPAKPSASLRRLLVHPNTWVSYGGTDVVATYASIEAQYIDLRLSGASSTAYHGVRDREITAYAPGLFTKSLINHPEPITVNGVRGYFGSILPWYNDDLPHAATHPTRNLTGSKYGDPLPAVAWQISTGQWVSVVSTEPDEDSAAALKAIAAKVRTANDPIRTPLKVGYLPPGQKLSEVDYTPTESADGAPESVLGFRTNTNQDYYNWSIDLQPTRQDPAGTVNGGGFRAMRSTDPVVSRKIGSDTITVETRGAISKEQALRVLASITLAAQPHAPNGTWFTLSDALP